MDMWATFWGWLLVIVLVVYALLAIVITIGGFFDVREMLSTMNEQHKPKELTDGNPSSLS